MTLRNVTGYPSSDTASHTKHKIWPQHLNKCVQANHIKLKALKLKWQHFHIAFNGIRFESGSAPTVLCPSTQTVGRCLRWGPQHFYPPISSPITQPFNTTQSKAPTTFYNKLKCMIKSALSLPLRHTADGNIAPPIPKLNGQPHASSPGYSTVQVLELDRMFWRETLLSLPKIKLWIIQPTAQSLYWLSYPSSTCIRHLLYKLDIENDEKAQIKCDFMKIVCQPYK
jgi:hypothetical protein